MIRKYHLATKVTFGKINYMTGEKFGPDAPESLPDLKETPAFRWVLEVAGEVLKKQYGLERKGWPFLDPSRIVIISKEELLERGEKTNKEVTLLERALLNLGAEREVISSSPVIRPVFTDVLESPPHLYVLGEEFTSLDSSRTHQWVRPAVDLGLFLIEMNLMFVAEERVLDAEMRNYWLKVLQEQIPIFFDKHVDLIPPDRRGEIDHAKQIFQEIIEGDDSLEFRARGGWVLAMHEQRGKGKEPLMDFGKNFNRDIASSLGTIPQRIFIGRIMEMLELEGEDEAKALIYAELKKISPPIYNQLLNKHKRESTEKTLRRLDKRKQEEGIPAVEEYLRRLELEGYLALFDAYRQSLIPQIYLRRKAVKKNLALYPLD